MATKGLTKK